MSNKSGPSDILKILADRYAHAREEQMWRIDSRYRIVRLVAGLVTAVVISAKYLEAPPEAIWVAALICFGLYIAFLGENLAILEIGKFLRAIELAMKYEEFDISYKGWELWSCVGDNKKGFSSPVLAAGLGLVIISAYAALYVTAYIFLYKDNLFSTFHVIGYGVGLIFTICFPVLVIWLKQRGFWIKPPEDAIEKPLPDSSDAERLEYYYALAKHIRI